MAHNEMYSHIEKLVKFHLVKYYYEKQGCDLIVDEFLPYCATLIFPYIELKIDDGGEQKSVMPIVDSLRKIKNIQELKEYTFESLNQILKKEWLPNLDFKSRKDLLSGISLVNSIQEDGIFTIKNNEKVLQHIVDKYNYELGQYGDNTIDNEEKKVEILKQPKIKKTKAPSLHSNNVPQYDKILELYNKLVSKRGDEEKIKELEYIWQWKISQGEYVEIKKLLEEEETKNIIKKVYKKNSKCLFIIVAYIAEHYKREWDGRSNNKEESEFLDTIGLKGYSRKIAENFFGKGSEKIYNRKIETKEKDNYGWLDSLRVEGGLPIKFINNNESSNNNIAKLIEGIYKKDDEKINKHIGNLNNQVLKQSYENKHSIYKYIESLLGGLQNVCAEGDLTNDLFKTYNEILEKGRQKSGKKFDIKYDVWKSSTSFCVNRSLVLKEYNDYNEEEPYLFSKKRLKGFNPYVFDLKYIIGDWSRKQHFVPYKNDDDDITLYQVDNHRCEIELPCLNSKNGEVEILIQKEDKWEKIESIDFPNEGYKEFRKDGGCEWRDKSYSRGDSSCAAVLYKTDVWKVDENYNPKKYVEGFNWVEYEDSLKLIRIKDVKEKILYNTSEKFIAIPTKDSFHQIVNHPYIKIEDKKIEVIKDGESKKVYLLKSPVDFDVKMCDEELDNEEIIVKKENVKIEYRTLDERNFCEYTKETRLSGYVIFRISLKNRNSNVILHSYILPKEANIKRHFVGNNNGSIILRNFEENEYKCETTLSDKFSNENAHEDYKDIEIKDTKDYSLKFKVARPLSRSDLFKDGKFVEDAVAIPIRFADKYEVRKFDDNGVKRINIKKDIDWQKLMGKLYETKGNYIYNYTKYNQNDIRIDNDFKFRVYTEEIKFDENIGYYVDSENDVSLDSLCFNLLLLDNDATLCDITIEEKKQNNTRYLVLNLPEERGYDGIILQSLKDKDGNQLHPQHYYRPIFVPKGQNLQPSSSFKKDRRYYNICQLSKQSQNDDLSIKTYKHFDVVCQCKCFFGALYELLALIHTPSCLILKEKTDTKKAKCVVGYGSDKCPRLTSFISKEKRLAKFYLGYVKYCKGKYKEPNYKELWRMAEEFVFDWLIIPRSVWLESISKEDADTEKNAILELFKHRTNGVYKGLLDEYWNLDWRDQRGKHSRAYGFMKYILDGTVQDINYKNWCKKCDIPSMPATEELSKEINRLKNRKIDNN